MATVPAITKDLPPILIGKPWVQEFTYRTDSGAIVDLTGYSAELRVTSSNQDGATLLVSATSTGGSITLDDARPNITVSISDVTTTALDASDTAYAYLSVTDGGGVEVPLLEGKLRIRYWGV